MLAGAVPIMVIMIVTAPDEEMLSSDCTRVDQSLRHWGRVLTDIQLGMTADSDTTNLSRDTAEAANAVRGEAASITDSSLRAKVVTLADNLDRVSHGDPKSPPNGWPDKNYMGGYQGTMATVHDLIKACPGVGDGPPPTGMPH